MESGHLIKQEDAELERLQAAEARLRGKYEYYQQEVGGLIDLELSLELVAVKLEIAIALIQKPRSAREEAQEAFFKEASDQANAAFALYEEVCSLNVSSDQTDRRKDSSLKEAIREKMQTLMLLGGAGFFEERLVQNQGKKEVPGIVYKAVAKYVMSDDRYGPLYKTEKLPQWLRRIVLHFLPVFAREKQYDPPYGIEEGEQEEVYHAHRMKMPLSQGIHYLEQELLPELKKRLAENPGDALLQERLKGVMQKLWEFRQIKILPRAHPLVQEKGYYTDSFNNYNHEGELLVNMNLDVSFTSGTNLDRQQYYVKTEVVRNLAGKGICPELDEEYEKLKSTASGRRGSWRTPGMRLDGIKWFPVLVRQIPCLRLVQDKQEFRRLLALVKEGRRGEVIGRLFDSNEVVSALPG